MDAFIVSKVPSREKCIYTSCYCEENVWHLCQLLTRETACELKCYCVFVSNPSKAVYLWKQKCATNYGKGDFPVVWDYHVFAVYGNERRGYYVLDLDTELPFPVLFEQYAREAIRSEENIFKRFFRVIPAIEFIRHFSSDRRHMKTGNSWQKPPPSYPPLISNPSNPHNLDDFVSMDCERGIGQVLSYQEFIKRFHHKK